MDTQKNSNALLYCSIWPDENSEISLENQSVELQTYCLMNGLDVVDIIFDVGSQEKGRLRNGMERLLSRVLEEGIGHIVIHDPGRIGRGRQDVLAFLQDTFDPSRTEIHITRWKMSSTSEEFSRLLSMAAELAAFELEAPDRTKGRFQPLSAPNFQPVQSDQLASAMHSEKFRIKPLWTKIFGMLQDERYAEVLIKALFQIGDSIQLGEMEYLAVHGGYDHLNMFRALGFRIKGEKTDNTKLVADVLVRYWDKVKFQLGPDVQKIIEGFEKGAVL